MTPAILARSVTRRYADLTVLDGLDLSVAPGEVVAIRGGSGTGKSTLLQLLGLLDRPDAGSISIAGRDAAGLPDAERSRVRARGIGFVFQAFHLLPDFDARENVVIAARTAGIDPVQAAAEADRLLASCGVRDPRQRVATLSGGERQRVALCRALVNRPALLLADEPTGNLDPATAVQAIGLLTGLARAQGSAVVLVTHDPAIATHADRRLELRGGRLHAG